MHCSHLRSLRFFTLSLLGANYMRVAVCICDRGSDMHNLHATPQGGKGVVAKSMEALQELFLTVLLPDRRLKVLEQQPLQVRNPRPRRAISTPPSCGMC